jgi:hypothetical protein
MNWGNTTNVYCFDIILHNRTRMTRIVFDLRGFFCFPRKPPKFRRKPLNAYVDFLNTKALRSLRFKKFRPLIDNTNQHVVSFSIVVYAAVLIIIKFLKF